MTRKPREPRICQFQVVTESGQPVIYILLTNGKMYRRVADQGGLFVQVPVIRRDSP